MEIGSVKNNFTFFILTSPVTCWFVGARCSLNFNSLALSQFAQQNAFCKLYVATAHTHTRVAQQAILFIEVIPFKIIHKTYKLST